MTLQKREKNLAIVAGALLAVVGAYYLWPSGPSLSSLRKKRDDLQAEINRKERILEDGRRAKAQIADWEKRALTVGAEHAKNPYYEWLQKLVEQSKMQTVTPGKIQPAYIGTAVGQSALTHKASGHHWIHAFAIEMKLTAPFGRKTCCQDARLADILPPPRLV